MFTIIIIIIAIYCHIIVSLDNEIAQDLDGMYICRNLWTHHCHRFHSRAVFILELLGDKKISEILRFCLKY